MKRIYLVIGRNGPTDLTVRAFESSDEANEERDAMQEAADTCEGISGWLFLVVDVPYYEVVRA